MQQGNHGAPLETGVNTPDADVGVGRHVLAKSQEQKRNIIARTVAKHNQTTIAFQPTPCNLNCSLAYLSNDKCKLQMSKAVCETLAPAKH